jgi:hypothetical protein
VRKYLAWAETEGLLVGPLPEPADLEQRLAGSFPELTLAQAMEQIRSLQEQLKQNSQNSSRPPSSYGPAVKRPPVSRKTGRQRGGPVGHKGHGRELPEMQGVATDLQAHEHFERDILPVTPVLTRFVSESGTAFSYCTTGQVWNIRGRCFESPHD